MTDQDKIKELEEKLNVAKSFIQDVVTSSVLSRTLVGVSVQRIAAQILKELEE